MVMWVIASRLLSGGSLIRLRADLVGAGGLVALRLILQIEVDPLAVGGGRVTAPEIEAVALGPVKLRVIPVQIEGQRIHGEGLAPFVLCQGATGDQKKREQQSRRSVHDVLESCSVEMSVMRRA